VSNSEESKIPEMSEGGEPTHNTDRLLKRLNEGSFAYRLVQAHRDRGTTDQVESVRAVLRERLEQVRRSLDHPQS